MQAQKAVTDAEKALLALQAPTALVMSEMEKPRETYLLIRVNTKTMEISFGIYAVDFACSN